MTTTATHFAGTHMAETWSSLLRLCDTLRRSLRPPGDPELWPVMALTRRITECTRSVALLAEQQQWSEAMIITRVLFEIEVILSWLSEKDTKQRLKTYLSGIDIEKESLRRKIDAGMSLTAKSLEHIGAKAHLRSGNPASSTGNRHWSGTDFRSFASQIDQERLYDVFYWLSSMYVHSHPLSVIAFDERMSSTDPLLWNMFSYSELGVARRLIVWGAPTTTLDALEAADKVLALDIAAPIAAIRNVLGVGLSRATNGMAVASWSAPPGEMQLTHPDGTASVLKVNRRQRRAQSNSGAAAVPAAGPKKSKRS